MNGLFKKIENFNFDVSKLMPEINRLIWNEDKSHIRTQVSLQTNGDDNWDAGIGSRPDESEQQWDKLHPELNGTVWEEFFAKLPFPVYRTRIMTMLPRTCYSIHRDISPRLHMAIKTNIQCKFIFTTPPPSIIYVPPDGNLWWIDTRKYHTAINGSLEPRVHLLMSLSSDDLD